MPATFLVFQTYLLLIIFKYFCGFSRNPWTIHAEPFAATEPRLRITDVDNRKLAKKNNTEIYIDTNEHETKTEFDFEKENKLLRIEHINARSIIGNFDEIKNLVIRNNTDILCVSETWLTDQTPDSFVYIKGYKLFRKDYEFNKIGGVAIYVRDELSSNEICFDVNAPRDIEAIFINVQLSKNPSFIVSTMYRHPQGKSETYTFINSVFNKMLKQNKTFYVLGDLNDNQLKNSKSPLKSIIYKNGLKQLIETPTRVTTTSSTLIDVIITNRRDSVLSLKNTPCSIADHNIITAFINVKKPKRAPITCTYRSMKNYSKDRFCELLAKNIDVLNNIPQTDNVDDVLYVLRPK